MIYQEKIHYTAKPEVTYEAIQKAIFRKKRNSPFSFCSLAHCYHYITTNPIVLQNKTEIIGKKSEIIGK